MRNLLRGLGSIALVFLSFINLMASAQTMQAQSSSSPNPVTAQTPAQTNASPANKGEAIYEKACKTCHSPETSPTLKSPLVHDQTAWAARVQEAQAAMKASPGKYKDIDAYFITQIRNGKGAMVPGGMCTDDTTPDKKCTDEDYQAAIKFMMNPQK